jgi:hypothetical protein
LAQQERVAIEKALHEYRDRQKRFESAVERRLVTEEQAIEHRHYLAAVIATLEHALEEDAKEREHDES